MLDITIETGKLESQLGWLARQVGMTTRALCYDQMRLWLTDLVRRTPPRTPKIGKDAVKRDLNKLFLPVDQKAVLDFFGEDIEGTGKTPGSVIFNLDGNMTRMAGFHKAHRTSQGRVRFKSSVVAKLGKWVFVSGMYVPAKAFKEYVRKIQSHVGTLKAGWLPALFYYAAKSGGPSKIPDWIKKQRRKIRSHTDLMRPDGNGYIESTNRVEWAGNNKSLRRWVAFTGRTRQRDIKGPNAIKRYNKVVREFNKAA